ncbi:S41 family peptidase [Bacteroides sp. 224]|uniref:S41 family peptidase n=1 Tax=Bacteroides sp. 224 TaxID=2302936 RepID=UPI0013D5846D|nr:S41 family peptidase [Bacteroides sp. 224]NDV67137.1 PDZ domain-containing protein [Bacteroides sp. 224]
MKTKSLLYVITCLLLISCGEDRRPEYAARKAADIWIEETMRQNYYWCDEIKTPNKGFNYFTEASAFYKSLLSSKDRNYSTIVVNKKEATRSLSELERSYGFEYEMSTNPKDRSSVARILYIMKNSPAANAGLKRGDIILKVNGERITSSNQEKLLDGSPKELNIGFFDKKVDSIVPYKEAINIEAARTVIDAPIHYSQVFDINGSKVGYLVYNRFDSDYNDQLLTLARDFKNKGINQFILDLRYNTGGDFDNARLLSSILAPSDKLGEPLGYKEFNNKTNPQKQEFMFISDITDANLNLKTLYILTTRKTSGESELVANCLSPYMDKIIIVGNTTAGKDVGSSESFHYSDDLVDLTLHPITYKIYNKDEADYSNGISPVSYNRIVESDSIKMALKPFGDPEELLLKVALGNIDGTYPPKETEKEKE